MGVSVEHLRRLLKELDAKIALEELRVAEYKEAVGAARGRWPKARGWSALRLGQVKHLYNLMETRQLVLLKLTFQHRTFYGQAVFSALELPDGTLIPLAKGQKLPVLELPNGSYIPAPKHGEATPKGAKPVTLPRGRIADIIEISGTGDGLAGTYELKTKNAIVDSAGRATDIHDVESESFKPKRALSIQTSAERVIQKAAQTLNARVIVQCDDPITGVSVIKRIAPAGFPLSQVMTYRQIPDRLAKQESGFIRLTLDKATKHGNIHRQSSAMGRLPSQDKVEATAKSTGRPILDPRGTAKVSEQGPLKPGLKSRVEGFSKRFIESRGVGTAARSIGGVNRALAPVGIVMLARAFSGDADAQQDAEETAAGLNIDDYEVGQEFTVIRGMHQYRIRVEEVTRWPSRLGTGIAGTSVVPLPGPMKKRFVFLSREVAPN